MEIAKLIKYVELDSQINELKKEMDLLKKELKESGQSEFVIDEKTSIKIIQGEKYSWKQDKLEALKGLFPDRFMDYFKTEYKHVEKKSIDRVLEVNGTDFSKGVKKALQKSQTLTVKVMRKK